MYGSITNSSQQYNLPFSRCIDHSCAACLLVGALSITYLPHLQTLPVLMISSYQCPCSIAGQGQDRPSEPQGTWASAKGQISEGKYVEGWQAGAGAAAAMDVDEAPAAGVGFCTDEPGAALATSAPVQAAQAKATREVCARPPLTAAAPDRTTRGGRRVARKVGAPSGAALVASAAQAVGVCQEHEQEVQEAGGAGVVDRMQQQQQRGQGRRQQAAGLDCGPPGGISEGLQQHTLEGPQWLQEMVLRVQQVVDQLAEQPGNAEQQQCEQVPQQLMLEGSAIGLEVKG